MRSIQHQRYRLHFEPLSPVHVGSGQTIEPCEYLLRRQGEEGFLIVLDLPRLFSELSEPERAEYDRVIDRGDLPGLHDWLRRRADPIRHRRFAIQVQLPVYDHIEQSADDPQRLGEINLFTRDTRTGRPYVPGSSIKGAIRTALVDDAAANAGHADERSLQEIAQFAGRPREQHKIGHAQRFEAVALGHTRLDRPDRPTPNLHRDLLRQLAIADITMPGDACYIDRVQIVQRPDRQHRGDPRYRQDEAENILIYRDMTWSLADGEAVAFTGEVRLSPHLADPKLMGRDRRNEPNHLPMALDIERLCRRCNDFYIPRLRDELERFRVPDDVADVVRDAAGRLEAGQCLIRLGRHSHFECVTLSEPYRQPPARGFGASRSYANDGQLPLGWARLRFEPWPGGTQDGP